MPTGNIPEAPELGHLAFTDKMLGPNGVRYRGVPMYCVVCSDGIHSQLQGNE